MLLVGQAAEKASTHRSRAIAWEAAPGLPSPCPGVLELCGDWLIQPERAQGGEHGGARSSGYASAQAERSSQADIARRD